MSTPQRSYCSVHVAWGAMFRIVAFLIALFSLFGSYVAAQASQSEYAVKAAFLYNFAKYVKWPPSALSSSASTIDIGVFGNDTCVKEMESAINSKTVEGRKVRVRRISNAKSAEDVHVLFIPRSSMGRIGELSELRGKPVLVVGESIGFARKHGQIGFVLDGNRLSFEINDQAARVSRLSISSKLLQLSKIVESDGS